MIFCVVLDESILMFFFWCGFSFADPRRESGHLINRTSRDD